MIFLTVGNWHKGFDRLVEAVDKLKIQGFIAEDVLAQIGSGSYKPESLNTIGYCSPTEFLDFTAESKIVITHAGIGTIAQALKLRKTVIVVPRKAELEECYDNHQQTTAKQLEKEGKILVAYETCQLLNKLGEAETFVPAEGQYGKEIIRAVETFIEKLQSRKYNRT